ncbi:MAG: acetyl-CoA acetyltransferase [Firmicutes bacterium]|nr:acetyl-CoA acetyltransferase [Bacillota bacterium]
MTGIKDRVAIIGMGCTKFGEHWDKSAEDLMVEAAYEAYEDAGIEPKDIKAAWLGMQYAFGTARGTMLSHALKLEYIPITRVENACCTATDAFRNACYAVAAGIYDLVLVLGIEKLKDAGVSGLPVSYAPFWGSRVDPPAPAPVQFALAATRYFHQYGLSYEEGKKTLGKIAVKNHHNGSFNPKAHFQKEITLDQVIKAPIIASPLGLFDCCGVSDGAAAAIITTPELAKNFRQDYILVKGLGLSCGARQGVLQDDYDMVHFEETVSAGRIAYQEAGIENPREEVDLAVVHDCFTITELLIYEDLGFSPRGRAKEDIDAGFFTLEGGLPVNTDGGLKCFGHPIGASGLRMIYEVYKQLQGKAGARQVKKADIGLTHNLGGWPGHFTCAVAIFGRKD